MSLIYAKKTLGVFSNLPLCMSEQNALLQFSCLQSEGVIGAKYFVSQPQLNHNMLIVICSLFSPVNKNKTYLTVQRLGK